MKIVIHFITPVNGAMHIEGVAKRKDIDDFMRRSVSSDHNGTPIFLISPQNIVPWHNVAFIEKIEEGE